MPQVKAIHHLKIAVADLDRSRDFFERVFQAKRIPEADHRRTDDGSLYAYILIMPGWGTLLELRLDPDRAAQQRGFNALTLSVEDRTSLEEWRTHLAENDVRHSEIITSIQAWLVALEDPDGHQLRLYTDEKHGPELAPDENNPWIAG